MSTRRDGLRETRRTALNAGFAIRRSRMCLTANGREFSELDSLKLEFHTEYRNSVSGFIPNPSSFAFLRVHSRLEKSLTGSLCHNPPDLGFRIFNEGR
jgi:hypothetical protein